MSSRHQRSFLWHIDDCEHYLICWDKYYTSSKVDTFYTECFEFNFHLLQIAFFNDGLKIGWIVLFLSPSIDIIVFALWELKIDFCSWKLNFVIISMTGVLSICSVIFYTSKSGKWLPWNIPLALSNQLTIVYNFISPLLLIWKATKKKNLKNKFHALPLKCDFQCQKLYFHIPKFETVEHLYFLPHSVYLQIFQLHITLR